MRLSYTPAAVRLINNAASEAARHLSHPSLGSEHLLLALISETEGVATESLCALGVSRDYVLAKIHMIVKPYPYMPTGILPRNLDFQEVLERARLEAEVMGSPMISSEHILLGLLGGGIGGQILFALGAHPERVRIEVIRQRAKAAMPKQLTTGQPAKNG